MLLMFGSAAAASAGCCCSGAVMAVEKNSPSGRALGTMVGILLLLVSAAIVASHVGPALL